MARGIVTTCPRLSIYPQRRNWDRCLWVGLISAHKRSGVVLSGEKVQEKVMDDSIGFDFHFQGTWWTFGALNSGYVARAPTTRT